MSDAKPADVFHCPICHEIMTPLHRSYDPKMGGGATRYIHLRWVCVQGDNMGNGHTVEIKRRAP